MAKEQTYPILFDEALCINISNLKRWGYLKENKTIQSNYQWNRDGERFAEISILVNMDESNPYIHLKYNYQGEPKEYKVKLFWKESNLNKGKIWFFICPKTFKYCRKLYLIEGFFLSREAFKGYNCMYEKQTYSKHKRNLDKTFGAYYGMDKAYEKVYSKHFKKYYAGKPTRRYLKMLKEVKKSESVSMEQVNSILFGNKP